MKVFVIEESCVVFCDDATSEVTLVTTDSKKAEKKFAESVKRLRNEWKSLASDETERRRIGRVENYPHARQWRVEGERGRLQVRLQEWEMEE